MFKPLAVVATAGLLFALGCKTDPESKIPTVAPKEAINPEGVLEHLQYVMVRNDPKHLETFAPENRSMRNSATKWFHSRSGDFGLALTAEEIDTLGVQDLVQKGYISDKWTRREYVRILKEMDEGKRTEFEPGMDRVNQMVLDMPTYPAIPPGMDKRAAEDQKKHYDALNKQRDEVLDANPKPVYAAGLYRILKCIPTNGWPLVAGSIHSNAGGRKDLKDIQLKYADIVLGTLAVGHNPDGTMFISYAEFKSLPSTIADMFPKKEEASK